MIFLDPNKILAYKPSDVVSRSQAMRNFGLTLEVILRANLL